MYICVEHMYNIMWYINIIYVCIDGDNMYSTYCLLLCARIMKDKYVCWVPRNACMHVEYHRMHVCMLGITECMYTCWVPRNACMHVGYHGMHVRMLGITECMYACWVSQNACRHVGYHGMHVRMLGITECMYACWVSRGMHVQE